MMMQKLSLEIIEPSNISVQKRKCVVDTTPFRVGRDPGNNWVIEDELKQISRTHFIIEYINNLFTIIDVSANGVCLNSAHDPIGRGKSSVLSHGDIIVLTGIKIRALIFDEPIEVGIDPFLNSLPERRQEQRNHDKTDEPLSSLSHLEPSALPMHEQDRPEDFRLYDSLLRDNGIDVPDRFLVSEVPETEFNFDRTPADLVRFEADVTDGRGIPENWLDEEASDVTNSDTKLNIESRSIKNNNELLTLLISQLTILEKAISEDEDLFLSQDPKEAVIQLSSIEFRTVSYVVKAIFSQAIAKIENSALRQTLTEKSHNNRSALEQDRS